MVQGAGPSWVCVVGHIAHLFPGLTSWKIPSDCQYCRFVYVLDASFFKFLASRDVFLLPIAHISRHSMHLGSLLMVVNVNPDLNVFSITLNFFG